MAITTLDGVIGGTTSTYWYWKQGPGTLAAGRAFTLNSYPGLPGITPTLTPGIQGEALTSMPGQLGFPAPVAGQNVYISRVAANVGGRGGTLILADRLWHNSGLLTNTSASQTVNSVQWPPRDKDGTSNGSGVYIGLEVTTQVGAGASSVGGIEALCANGNTVYCYRTTSVGNFTSAPIGTFQQLGESRSGDPPPVNLSGIRKINSWQAFSSGFGGAFRLVAFRPLLVMPISGAQTTDVYDALTSGLIRCWDNTVPFFIYYPHAVEQPFFMISVTYVQG